MLPELGQPHKNFDYLFCVTCHAAAKKGRCLVGKK